MKIAVTGINGNIGRTLISRGALPLDCDVTDEDDVRRAIKRVSPDIIIHTASKSKPDWCELNSEQALQVNFIGSRNVFSIAKEKDIPVVALSTDHVFSGKFSYYKPKIIKDKRKKYVKIPALVTFPGPYSENEPRILAENYYGLTKYAMEGIAIDYHNVKIVRTSNCFWKDDPRAVWYINELYSKDKVPVPTFQYRSFMHKEHFAQSLEKYCKYFVMMPKLLHISGSKTVNWYEFILAFADALDIPKSLTKKFTKRRFETQYFLAQRPKKAGLKVDLSKKLGLPQFDYKDGMKLVKQGL